MSQALPTGIARDRHGWRVYVRVRGELRTKRFPADATLQAMQIWRLQQQDVKPNATPKPEPNTMGADVVVYLTLKKGMPTYDTRAAMMQDWAAALGPTRERAKVTSLEIAQTLAGWQETFAYAPSSLNHYRSALSDFYTRLDPAAPNPVKGVPKFREPEPAPRGVSYRLIRAVLAATPRWRLGKDGRRLGLSATRAVLSVLAYTGMPPAVIRALKPEHVLWDEQAVVMPARRKGRGTSIQRRALTRQGVAALRRFAAAGAWGGVASSTMTIVFHRAVARVRLAHPDWAIPADLRAYDFRHSYAEAVYRATSSVAITAGLLGHLDERTTRRYIGGAVNDVERAAVEAVRRGLR